MGCRSTPYRFVPGIAPGLCRPADDRFCRGRRASAEFSITLNLVSCPCAGSSGALFAITFWAYLRPFLWRRNAPVRCRGGRALQKPALSRRAPRYYSTQLTFLQEKFTGKWVFVRFCPVSGLGFCGFSGKVHKRAAGEAAFFGRGLPMKKQGTLKAYPAARSNRARRSAPPRPGRAARERPGGRVPRGKGGR